MKQLAPIVILSVLLLVNCKSMKTTNYSDWEELSKASFENTTYILKRIIDSNDYRVNPQNTKFYKTKYVICIEKNGIMNYKEISEYFYASEDKNGFSTPCLLLETITKNLFIFVYERENNKDNYAMSGYVYLFNELSNTLKKETVFAGSNFGWYSFFGGVDNGNPILCHFSYAGYFAMESKRNNDGTWTTTQIGALDFEKAKLQYKNHKNFLITDQKRVDKMTDVQ